MLRRDFLRVGAGALATVAAKALGIRAQKDEAPEVLTYEHLRAFQEYSDTRPQHFTSPQDMVKRHVGVVWESPESGLKEHWTGEAYVMPPPMYSGPWRVYPIDCCREPFDVDTKAGCQVCAAHITFTKTDYNGSRTSHSYWPEAANTAVTGKELGE